VLERVGERFSLARSRIERREHRADEDDQRERVLAVVAERIDVPPRVAATRDRVVEARSAESACAASFPLNAAIGTPAPGWTLPPARYRPCTFVRLPGRDSVEVIPCVARP
jgi:hypothetical protein